MWVRMVRPVVAGRQPRRVNAVVELSEAEAQMLIRAGSAVASAPPPSTDSDDGAARPAHLLGIEHAVDAHAVRAEHRGAPMDWGETLVSAIDGIGPVTARRLAEGGIDTVSELLAADPADVALIASVKVLQVEKWRQRAQAVIDGNA